MAQPTIKNVRTEKGVAGNAAVSGVVQYPGEDPMDVSFTTAGYGAPVYMVTKTWGQVRVQPEVIDRLGARLDRHWFVTYFYGARP